MDLAKIAEFAEREYPDACIAPWAGEDGSAPHLEVIWDQGRVLFAEDFCVSILRGGEIRSSEGAFDFERELRWVYTRGRSEHA